MTWMVSGISYLWKNIGVIVANVIYISKVLASKLYWLVITVKIDLFSGSLKKPKLPSERGKL